MSQKYDRFKEAPWFSTEKKSVLIGGAGGIGSWLTVLLTRAGFECHVFDFDTVEEVNMAGQLFAHSSIGNSKVEAVSEMTSILCEEVPFIYEEAITPETMSNNIVFTAFDNIAARKIMFESWKRDYTGQEGAIFIDGRLLAEQLTIYCIKATDNDAIIDYTNNHLPDDSLIPDAPCAFKQTSHFAAGIADKMVRLLTNFIAGQGRAVPYKVEEIGPMFFTKVIMNAPKQEVKVAEDVAFFDFKGIDEEDANKILDKYKTPSPILVDPILPPNGEILTYAEVIQKYGHHLTEEQIEFLRNAPYTADGGYPRDIVLGMVRERLLEQAEEVDNSTPISLEQLRQVGFISTDEANLIDNIQNDSEDDQLPF